MNLQLSIWIVKNRYKRVFTKFNFTLWEEVINRKYDVIITADNYAKVACKI